MEPSSANGFWPLPSGSPAGAAVPEAEPQVAVGPEGELPAVVVREGLIHGEEDVLAGGVEHGCGIPVLRARQLRQHSVAVPVAVMHEGTWVIRPVGMEHQPEQARSSWPRTRSLMSSAIERSPLGSPPRAPPAR